MPKGFRVFLLCSLLSVPFLAILGFSPAHAALFINRTGACLDDRGGLTGQFNPIQSFPCNATFAQQWNFEGQAIQGVGTTGAGGKCVEIQFNGTAAGTIVELFQCSGNVGQRWEFINGQLINPNSGKCLDVGNAAAGTQATIQFCNFSAGQLWGIRS